MNCVDYAIDYVRNSDIDDYILKLAFESPNNGFTGNWYNVVKDSSISQGIRERVIYQTVLRDCNVLGGVTEFIDLSSANVRDIGNGMVEVNVPDQLTGGRHIIDVETVYIGTMSSVIGAMSMGVNSDSLCGQGTMHEMLQTTIDSLTGNRSIPPTYSNIHMTGNNSFVIVNATAGTLTMTAKCLLEYDQGLSSIHRRAYQDFGELCLLATKAFIYRNCRRPIQEAVIRSGVPIDEIRDDVGEYRDSFREYKEFFETTWTKRMAYSDRQKVVESIEATVPSRI